MDDIKKRVFDYLDSIKANYTFEDNGFIKIVIYSLHISDELNALRGICYGYRLERISFGDIYEPIFIKSTLLISPKTSDNKLFQALGDSISISSLELLSTNDTI